MLSVTQHRVALAVIHHTKLSHNDSLHQCYKWLTSGELFVTTSSDSVSVPGLKRTKRMKKKLKETN